MQVRSWLYYANDTLDLLIWLTADAGFAFTNPILGERFASMLNHNIHQLLGSKSAELKVDDEVIFERTWNGCNLKVKGY